MTAVRKELNEKYRVGSSRKYAVIAAYAANTWGLSAARLVLTVHFVHVLIRRRVWDDRLSDNALLLRSPTSRALPDHARRNLRKLRLPPLVSPPPPSPHVRRVLIPIPRLELPPYVFLSLPM